MIQLNSLQSTDPNTEFYTIAFNRIRFALIPAPDLTHLQAFSRSNQNELGKTEVRLQVDWLNNYLSFFKDIDYVLLTHHREVLLLPFLLRKCPQINIVATSLMAELARIHLLAFQERVKEFDATSSTLDYHQDMHIRDEYEQKFDIDLTNNPTIFCRQEAQSALKRVLKLNYFQQYDTERGITLVAHPSGKNNGSCLWQLQGQATREKLLLVNDVSYHQWRTCQPYNLSRLKSSHQQQPFQHIIFTRKALANLNRQTEEQRTAEFLNKIATNMANSISTVIVISDETAAVDLIPRIAFQPEGKCQTAFFSNACLHDFTNYCNSYVDYLSEQFRSIIFSESPDYPLIHYSRLSEKGLILVNGLEDTAIRKKIPIREVVLQSSPFVLFIQEYQHYLQTQDLTAITQNVKYEVLPITIDNHFTTAHLEKFISTFTNANIYSFGIDTDVPRVNKLQINIKHHIGQQSHPNYISAANLTPAKVHQYTLINNQLQLKPLSRDILLLPKVFMEHIFDQFIKRGYSVLHKDHNSMRTDKTAISLSEEFLLKVSSSHIDEVLTIERILTPMIETHSFA